MAGRLLRSGRVRTGSHRRRVLHGELPDRIRHRITGRERLRRRRHHHHPHGDYRRGLPRRIHIHLGAERRTPMGPDGARHRSVLPGETGGRPRGLRLRGLCLRTQGQSAEHRRHAGSSRFHDGQRVLTHRIHHQFNSSSIPASIHGAARPPRWHGRAAPFICRKCERSSGFAHALRTAGRFPGRSPLRRRTPTRFTTGSTCCKAQGDLNEPS